MNGVTATPAGWTAGGGAGGVEPSTVGSVNDERSLDTDEVSRFSTVPATPASTPAPMKPMVTNDSRRPRSGASPATGASGEGFESLTRPETRNLSTTTPNTVPITVGTTSTTVAPALLSTAAQPMTPATAMATLPTGVVRVSRRAVSAAIMPITTRMTTVRNNLSDVPNRVMAHSLTGPGVRSMTAEPMAVRES